MPGSEVLLKYGNRTGDQVVSLFDAAEKATQPTVGDLLYAGQRQRSRILSRTARGVDVDETAFHPYSRKGPIYYYPGTSSKNRGAAVANVARSLGLGKGRNSKVVRVAGAKTQYVQRTAKGLKFSSYAALKAAFGRLSVDLRGLRAPHMLQALIVRCSEFVLGNVAGANSPLPVVAEEPASEVTIGIYGEEATRASGHQKGAGYLPKRKFVGANEQDKNLMLNDILTRIAFRVRKALGISSTVASKEDTL